MLQIKELINDYRSGHFIEEVETFVGSRLVTLLEQTFNISGASSVKPFPTQGSVSLIFETQLPTGEAVIRFIEQEELYWNDVVGMTTADKAGVAVPKLLHHQSISDTLFMMVVEKINLPTLQGHIENNKHDTQWASVLALNITKLHKMKKEGFGGFRYGTFESIDTREHQRDNILQHRLSKGNQEYVIANQLLTGEQVKEIVKRVQNLTFDTLNSFTHGDFYTGNVFYDSAKNHTVIFDFASALNDPLFDLARLSSDLHAKGHDELWNKFVEEYDHIIPINQDRLRTIQAVVLLKKMINAHKREKYESAERLREVIASTLA